MTLFPHTTYIGNVTIIVGAVAGFLAILFVGLRIWARRLKSARLDASDWTCIAALMVSLGLLGSTINTVSQGLGHDNEELSFEQLVKLGKGLFIRIFTWTTSNTLVRVSMILLYLRLFPSRRFAMICWFFLVENMLSLFATFTATLLICRPIAYTWDQVTIDGRCGNQRQFYLWLGVHNLISDVIIIAMPMPLLWNLHLPWRKKVSLTLVFAMGAGICIITLIRTIEMIKARQRGITAAYASIGVLSILEPLLGIVNCCLPILRPVSKTLLRKIGISREPHEASNESPLQTIGSKRMRPRFDDPYALDVLSTTKNRPHTPNWRNSTVEGGESVTNLMRYNNSPNAIHVKNDWDVEFDTGK